MEASAMPTSFYQSTGRTNHTLEYRQLGRRAYLLSHRNLAEVARRHGQGRSLAVAIGQFGSDEIDADDLRDEIQRSAVNPSGVDGYLGSLIVERFYVCDDCDTLEHQDDCLVVDNRALCESCRENYYTCEHCDEL